MPSHGNRTIVDTVIDPVRGEIQSGGNLGNREVAQNLTRVRLAAVAQNPMLQTDGFNRTRQ